MNDDDYKPREVSCSVFYKGRRAMRPRRLKSFQPPEQVQRRLDSYRNRQNKKGTK